MTFIPASLMLDSNTEHQTIDGTTLTHDGNMHDTGIWATDNIFYYSPYGNNTCYIYKFANYLDYGQSYTTISPLTTSAVINYANYMNNYGTGVWSGTLQSSTLSAPSAVEPSLMSNICFVAGTPITTDQGNIPIEKMEPSIHTIRNKKIVAITKTVTQDKYLVCFETDALGKNIPSQQTIISKNHKLFYNGKMRMACEFLKGFDRVVKVKYTGAILYNVLLEEHDNMMVNNLICETLHPDNGVAQVYMALQKLDTDGQHALIQKINAHVIKNDVFNINNKKRLNNL